jgi:hypothetical protein
MRRKTTAIITLLLIQVLAIAAFPRETITPFGRPKTVGFDNGKGRIWTYYCLVKGQSLGFAIEGPARADIRSRAGLSNEDIQAEYQVQVWENEYLMSAEKFKSKAIEAEMKGTNLYPAAFRRVSFDVPAGVHNYRLWLVSDNIDTAFVRLYKSDPTDEEPEEVDIHLLSFKRRVHLYSKKNQTPYYLVDKEGGAKLRVTGPADIIVRTRANFSSHMDGRIGFTIAVMEDGKEIETLSATTSKSLTMAYQDYTGVVPSKPIQFIFNAPAGNHVYDFILKESAAETISIRFTIPDQD